ncbi:protein kinase [Roseateles sp. BYS78W]|uniref:Protein kinase n=1 Tax=Pelomonas candidula TaxID=3299025 RepID=A0ABW7HD06_9BURK
MPSPSPADENSFPVLDQLLDELLALPPGQRAAAVERFVAGHPVWRRHVEALVSQLDGADELLDHPALELIAGPADATLLSGQRLGPWRLQELIGRGGMGEVYRARREDGSFEQFAAVKLMRADLALAPARFEAERQLLARLEHPGIARLLDGGVTDEGRPYMIMELVEGLPVQRWCAQSHATLAQRLDLFIGVCEAVAYAHRALVVHRDLKPANVLVTADGHPKLLDFGLARALDALPQDLTRETLLTPAYAAPEQLAGGVITTAVDVYALGLLLHEMLTGRPAFEPSRSAWPMAAQRAGQAEPMSPSRVAEALAQPPVPAARLQGDLDAIVAKATRLEPEARYASVEALRDDVLRHLRLRPVLARQGNWRYLAARTLRRHRAWVAAGGVALLALLGGAGLAVWQAHEAELAAARANAVKSYLLQVFRASDPRTASDRPRGQITARELLDLGAARIDSEFATQPGLQLELLGELASLYRELGETARYEALQAHRLQLAERLGNWQAVAEVWLNRNGDAADANDSRLALQHLQPADQALQRGGLRDSLLQARWWLSRAQSLPRDDFPGRGAALREARRLYERLDPRAPGYVTTLIEAGLLAYDGGGDDELAVALYREALAAYATAHDRDDGEAQTLYGNLAEALLNLGRFDEAQAIARQGLALAERTYGEAHGDYWVPASNYARLLHLGGDRDAAWRMLDHVFPLLPRPPTSDAWKALGTRLDCMVNEGHSSESVPLARAIVAAMDAQPNTANARYRSRLRLGEALWQHGDIAEAEQFLRAAWRGYVDHESADRQTRLWATGLLGRFLLSQGHLDEAESLLREVIARDAHRHLSHVALARSDLARLMLARGQAVAALTESAAAQQAWRDVHGFRDVRMGVAIDLARAQALAATGERAQAQRLAQEALANSQKWDAPEAPAIKEARALLAALSGKPAP